jgi:homoserine O-acetyltransferase
MGEAMEQMNRSPASSDDPGAAARAAFVAPETQHLDLPGDFALELGERLRGVRVAYRTWGQLDADGKNAVVICHALTGSADADRWWTRLFGPGRALEPDKDFVVCSNVLGSCYGTTGPTSIDPATGRPYLGTFPSITIRDMVRLQAQLVKALGVKRIRMVIGGSLGGMQTLEWALMYPDMAESFVAIATSGRHSPWCIGISEAQRQAIYADPRWRDGRYDLADPPSAGLAAARMMAMCSYRSRPSFEQRFGRRPQAANLFAVESYLRHQGQSLVERFDAATYVALTQAMDTHDLARGRGEYAEVLRSVRQPSLVVSIDSDVLYLPDEQREVAEGVRAARSRTLHSPHGHDAFLIDVDALSDMVSEFRGRPAAQARPQTEPIARVFAEKGRSLFVMGKGKVGSQFLDQLQVQRAQIEQDSDVVLRVVGLAGRSRRVFREEGIWLDDWRTELARGDAASPFGGPGTLELLDRLAGLPAPVLVDLTAANGMETVYEEAFRRGIHVVSANKRPLACAWPARERMEDERRRAGRQFLYEAAVGATVPVIGTLRTLVRRGDQVKGIEASLSGTLGYLLDEVTKGAPLSLAARWARELGYTEEDPRDDLSGLDSARKAVVLARELGLHLSLEDVQVEPLVPREVLGAGSIDDLYDGLRGHDGILAARVASAARRGKVLRYLIRLVPESGGSARMTVGPAEVEAGHWAARLSDVEALVAFTTDRYQEHPLMVQGAGVGGAITAGAVVAEILKIPAGRWQG